MCLRSAALLPASRSTAYCVLSALTWLTLFCRLVIQNAEMRQRGLHGAPATPAGPLHGAAEWCAERVGRPSECQSAGPTSPGQAAKQGAAWRAGAAPVARCLRRGAGGGRGNARPGACCGLAPRSGQRRSRPRPWERQPPAGASGPGPDPLVPPASCAQLDAISCFASCSAARTCGLAPALARPNTCCNGATAVWLPP